MAEFLARLADRRRIDERHVGGRVRHQDGVEERLVARLQIGQNEIFLQIVVKTGNFVVAARHLKLERGYCGWQQALEPVGVSLRLGESGALVETRVTKKLIACGAMLVGGHLDLLWMLPVSVGGIAGACDASQYSTAVALALPLNTVRLIAV